MNHHEFSPLLKSILAEVGWFPGRVVDISLQVSELTEFGFEVTETVASFMREFSGLRVNRPNGEITFNWRDADRWVLREDVPFINALLGSPLCLVGHGGRQFFLIGSAGQYVFLNDEWVFFEQFTTLEEALNHIFLLDVGGRSITYIPNDKMPPGFRE
jgi:hypothetical protein